MIGKVAFSLAMFAVVPEAIAFCLIASQGTGVVNGSAGLDFNIQLERGHTDPLLVALVLMRDGVPRGHMATTAYSYRLNTSYAPGNDYPTDSAALPPFLLAVGDHGEACEPEGYQPLISPQTDQGRYVQSRGPSGRDARSANPDRNQRIPA